MIEGCWLPAVGRMAGGAVVVELSLNVVRIGNIRERLLVARPAIGRSAPKPPAHMASGAIHCPVSPR